jgi:hypothetical protein
MDMLSLEKYLASVQQLAKRYFRQVPEALNEIEQKSSIERADEKTSMESGPRERLNTRLNAVCDIYLTTADKERAELRSVLGRFSILLNSLPQYMDWCQRQIKTEEDRVRLRRALAAASLADNRVDDKEMCPALASLYETCVKAGLYPSKEFVNIGRLSNPEGGRTKISMRDLLMDFENSAFFRSNVRPRLWE